jgi:hypothetical protein
MKKFLLAVFVILSVWFIFSAIVDLLSVKSLLATILALLVFRTLFDVELASRLCHKLDESAGKKPKQPEQAEQPKARILVTG